MYSTGDRMNLDLGLPKKYELSHHGKHIRITTPFIYSDGDMVDLYITTIDNKDVLTDFGMISGSIYNKVWDSDECDVVLDEACKFYDVKESKIGISIPIEDIQILRNAIAKAIKVIRRTEKTLNFKYSIGIHSEFYVDKFESDKA